MLYNLDDEEVMKIAGEPITAREERKKVQMKLEKLRTLLTTLRKREKPGRERLKVRKALELDRSNRRYTARGRPVEKQCQTISRHLKPGTYQRIWRCHMKTSAQKSKVITSVGI